MASFRYKAMTEAGAVVAGSIEAESEMAAVQWIRGQGHYPMSTAAEAESGWRSLLHKELKWSRGLSQRDLAVATRELAVLLRAGLPLDRALAMLVGMGDGASLRGPIEGVLARVRDGAGLADAFAADPVFPKLYVAMVRAGETGGNLDEALLRLADYCARTQAVRDSILSALVYPAILVCTAGLSMLFILVFVLPEFETMFRNAGRQLPLATRIVMGFGKFIGAYWWGMAALAVAAAAGLRRALRRPALRRGWDAARLRLPILGDLTGKIELERLSRTLGTLLGNGVALPTALGMVRVTIGNSVIAAAIGDAQIGLREGDGLAERLAGTGVFPASTLDFVRVGEQTGKLDEMLLHQADLYEQTIKHRIERLMAMFVPVLTILLGIMVAALVASMLVAILSVNDLAVRK